MTIENKADAFLEEFQEYMETEQRMNILPHEIRTAWAQGYQAALDDIVMRNMSSMEQVYGFIQEVTGENENTGALRITNLGKKARRLNLMKS